MQLCDLSTHVDRIAQQLAVTLDVVDILEFSEDASRYITFSLLQ